MDVPDTPVYARRYARDDPRLVDPLHRVEVYARRCQEAGADLILEFVTALAQAGPTTCALTRRLLQLRDVDVACLADTLETDGAIEEMDLAGNHIGADGAGHLGRVLRTNQHLRKLSLAQNPIGEDGCAALLEGLQSNSTLTSLDLTATGLTGGRGADRLAAVLQTPGALREAVLDGNQLGDPAVSNICNALTASAMEESPPAGPLSLHVAGNDLGPDSAGALARVLGSAACRLVALDLAGNHLGPAGGRAIAEALTINRSLLRINLRGNGLTAEGVTACAAALLSNATLEELYIGDNNVAGEGAAPLVDAVSLNTSLRAICLLGTPLPAGSVRQLLKCIATRPALACVFWAPAAVTDVEDGLAAALAERQRKGWGTVAIPQRFQSAVMRQGVQHWLLRSEAPPAPTPGPAPVTTAAAPTTPPPRGEVAALLATPSPPLSARSPSPSLAPNLLDWGSPPIGDFTPAELELIRQMDKKIELERLHYRQHIRDLEEQLEGRRHSPGPAGLWRSPAPALADRPPPESPLPDIPLDGTLPPTPETPDKTTEQPTPEPPSRPGPVAALPSSSAGTAPSAFVPSSKAAAGGPPPSVNAGADPLPPLRVALVGGQRTITVGHAVETDEKAPLRARAVSPTDAPAVLRVTIGDGWRSVHVPTTLRAQPKLDVVPAAPSPPPPAAAPSAVRNADAAPSPPRGSPVTLPTFMAATPPRARRVTPHPLEELMEQSGCSDAAHPHQDGPSAEAASSKASTPWTSPSGPSLAVKAVASPGEGDDLCTAVLLRQRYATGRDQGCKRGRPSDTYRPALRAPSPSTSPAPAPQPGSAALSMPCPTTPPPSRALQYEAVEVECHTTTTTTSTIFRPLSGGSPARALPLLTPTPDPPLLPPPFSSPPPSQGFPIPPPRFYQTRPPLATAGPSLPTDAPHGLPARKAAPSVTPIARHKLI